MSGGVYRIRNTVTNRCYYGSTVDFQARWSSHLIGLRTKEHHNAHLQASWNKYGESKFVFEVMETIDDKKLLLEREQHYLDRVVVWGVDYNLARVAGQPRGRTSRPKPRETIWTRFRGWSWKVLGPPAKKKTIPRRRRKKKPA
jgi:group I intron endonuclease